MEDVEALWDPADPVGSEERLRAAADVAEGAQRLQLLTLVTRALGRQERYDEAHAELDHLAVGDTEVAVRVALERGRLLRAAGAPEEARPHLEAAAASAGEAGLDALEADARGELALLP